MYVYELAKKGTSERKRVLAESLTAALAHVGWGVSDIVLPMRVTPIPAMTVPDEMEIKE